MVDQLKARYEAVCAAAGLAADAADMTVVFDAGQNSEANFAHFAATGLRTSGPCPPVTARTSPRARSQAHGRGQGPVRQADRLRQPPRRLRH